MYSKFIDHICFEFNTPDGKMKFYAQRAGSNIFRYTRWVEPEAPIKNMNLKLKILDGKPCAVNNSGKIYSATKSYSISKEEFYSHMDNVGVLFRGYHIHLFEIDGKKYCLYSASVTDRCGRTHYDCVNDMPLANTPFAVEYICSHYCPGQIVDFKITNGIDSYWEYSQTNCSEEDFIMSFYTE